MIKGRKKILDELDSINALMLKTVNDFKHLLKEVHPENKKNTINFLHYLAIRSLDIRALQKTLHNLGLSSMASSESHVLGQLLSVSKHLNKNIKVPKTIFNYESGQNSIKEKSIELFGNKQLDMIPYIMVTLDSSLAGDYEKTKSILQSGMNIARINCVHDNESIWLSMIENIRRAEKVTGLSCKIYMDLAGRKIRTIIDGGQKIKIKEGKIIYLIERDKYKGGKQTIGCSITGIVDKLKIGEKVFFDDGLIECRIDNITKHSVKLVVIRISKNKKSIKTEKGINFPESSLSLSSFTEYDKACLPFIFKYADIIGLSFIQSTNDLTQLYQLLEKNKTIGVVLKIETPEAVKNLPEILINGMRRKNLGVMIARGDLAVEVGFERTSEIQEEILWLCEAAHIPVIWATQVLETLNKSGIPSRSELTDAAFSASAECVMLNKGSHIIETMEMLREILIRSQGHHSKKRYTFRPLHIANDFLKKNEIGSLKKSS